MPRYYFHIMDGRAVVDNEGTNLPDMAGVRQHAIQMAGHIIANIDTGLTKGWPWQMTVADADGKTVFSLWFEAREPDV